MRRGFLFAVRVQPNFEDSPPGTPNGWSDRTVRGVFGLLFVGSEVCVWLAVMAVVTWFGARRSTPRLGVLKILIAVESFTAFLFSFIALSPMIHLPVWLTLLIAMAPLPLIIFFAMKKAAQPSDPPEKTPEACWSAGVIYHNPHGMALVVEKRDGFGYTLNFGNRWSWLLADGLLLVLASIPLVLF